MLPDRKHDGKVQHGPMCSWHGGARAPSEIRWVVIHDAEATNAQNVAAWGASSGARGRASWHVVVDNEVAIRCVADDVVAYHAYSPANDVGLGVEICGYASWSKLTWFRNQATLKRAAWVVARWCRRYGVPPRYLKPGQILAQEKGLLFHADVTRVLGRGSHTDPGPNFPKGYFLLLVRRRLKWLEKSAV